MAWWMAAAGLNAAQGFLSFQADKAQAKAQRAWQAYSNTMTELSNSNNQNSITTNELLANQAFADQALQIKRGSIFTQAKAEVAAAAAGVKGQSVNQAMFSVQRNAAAKEYSRQVSLKNAQLAFDQQRVNSSLSSAMQKDHSYIPKPNPVSYFLKAASSTMSSAASMGYI